MALPDPVLSYEAPPTFQYQSREAAVTDDNGGLRAGVHRTVLPSQVCYDSHIFGVNIQLGPETLVPGHVVNLSGAALDVWLMPEAADLTAAHPGVVDGTGFSLFVNAASLFNVHLNGSPFGTTKIDGGLYIIPTTMSRKLIFFRQSATFWTVRVA